MSFTGEGFGSASDAEIVAAPVEEVDAALAARIEAGKAEAHATYLAEAKDAVERLIRKLEDAKAAVVNTEAAVAAAQAEVAALEEGGN